MPPGPSSGSPTGRCVPGTPGRRRNQVLRPEADSFPGCGPGCAATSSYSPATSSTSPSENVRTSAGRATGLGNPAAPPRGVGERQLVVLVDVEGQLGPAERGRGADVVVVAVGGQDGDRPLACRLEQREHAGPVEARVDDQGLVAPLPGASSQQFVAYGLSAKASRYIGPDATSGHPGAPPGPSESGPASPARRSPARPPCAPGTPRGPPGPAGLRAAANASTRSRAASGGAACDPRRAPALPSVAVQRELRDHEHLAAHVLERTVHLALVVLEDPQVDDLPASALDLAAGARRRRTPTRIRRPGPDLRDRLPVDPDRGAGHALERGGAR